MYKALPIKVDFEESENVYNSIFFLFSTNHKVVRPRPRMMHDHDVSSVLMVHAV